MLAHVGETFQPPYPAIATAGMPKQTSALCPPLSTLFLDSHTPNTQTLLDPNKRWGFDGSLRLPHICNIAVNAGTTGTTHDAISGTMLPKRMSI